MIDILDELDQKMLAESKKSRRHIFNDDTMTFKQLKELFNDVFSTSIVKVSRHVPTVSMYVTNKDGEFYIASTSTPQKLLKTNAVKQALHLDECECSAVDSTLNDVIDVMKTIDSMLVNRYFANGKNMLKCTLVCPPNGCGDYYGDKCFIQFDGIDCFDKNCKSIGQDQKSSFELFKILKSNDNLTNELGAMSAEQLSALRKCRTEKNVLQNAIDALSKLVDGIGWGCSIKYYIQDKYARSIVNKALEHGLDVSKNGSFVNELAARLSGTSSSRPTKSDLVTFAKREGIDCNSQEYKDFLSDIESSAEQASKDIIAPIENVIYYVVSKAATNIIGLMALDPNPHVKKLLNQIAVQLFDTCDDINQCGFNVESLANMKKALQKLCTYKDMMPTEIRVMAGGKPYSIVGDASKIQRLLEVVE